MNVRELPDTENPVFKLKYFGPQVLSNAELLQLLTGVRDLEVASEVLAKSGGLSYLHKMTTEELRGFAGIGDSMACKIVAAMEFGRRASQVSPIEAVRISRPEDVYDLFSSDYLTQTQEVLSVVLLNAKNEVMGKEIISKGNFTSAQVNPCDVYRPAIKKGAVGIILVHNHPSGDPSPSDDDIYATKRIEQCGDLVGIKAVDHVIIGHGRFSSLKSMNMMEFGAAGNQRVSEKNVIAKNKERDR